MVAGGGAKESARCGGTGFASFGQRGGDDVIAKRPRQTHGKFALAQDQHPGLQPHWSPRVACQPNGCRISFILRCSLRPGLRPAGPGDGVCTQHETREREGSKPLSLPLIPATRRTAVRGLTPPGGPCAARLGGQRGCPARTRTQSHGRADTPPVLVDG